MSAWKWAVLIIILFFGGSFVLSLTRAWSKSAVQLPDPAIDAATTTGTQSIVLAGGCFWCTEAVLEGLAGVTNVVSGYAGGSAESAKYSLVSGGGTQHAEAIQVTWDPSRITLGRILKVFFSVAHDPTQVNRQGPDHGYQYRSAVFYSSEGQRKVAEAYIRQLEQARAFPASIATKVVWLPEFFPAEPSHQDYVKRNPRDPYVIVNAAPKLSKLKQAFPDLVR